MRDCLFCPNPANSLEDAWPLWIAKQYRGNAPSQLRAERQGQSLPPWDVWQPELKVRRVCRECNNGWMSRLESQSQPTLQPLLSGQSHSLTSGEQATVALWAVKTAMVLEGLGPIDQRVYTEQERAQLRLLSVIPERTSVWLAVSVDKAVFMSTKTRHFNESPTDDPSAVCTTIGLSHLVLQVLTLRVPPDVSAATRITTSVRTGPWQDATLQVWPLSSTTILWPPSVGLDGEIGLDALGYRFMVAGLPDGEVQSLAI